VLTNCWWNIVDIRQGVESVFLTALKAVNVVTLVVWSFIEAPWQTVKVDTPTETDIAFLDEHDRKWRSHVDATRHVQASFVTFDVTTLRYTDNHDVIGSLKPMTDSQEIGALPTWVGRRRADAVSSGVEENSATASVFWCWFSKRISYCLAGYRCSQAIDDQWLKCKIRGGGTLHSGLGPWQWSCAFP